MKVMRFIVSAVTAVLTVVSLQAAAHAHYVWATVANGQARFALLENVSAAPSAQFEKYVADLSPRCSGKRLTLGASRDGARYAALPASLPVGQGVVVAESIVGVRERDGETYLLVYHAKGAASLAAAGTVTKAAAELSAYRNGDSLTISVRQNGWPIPRSDVWVQWPGDAAPSSIQTNAKGEAQVPWSVTHASDGFVGIRTMVKERKAGEADGKRYDSVHRWATLTFPVTADDTPKAASSAPAQEKPFTQILRASYGVSHDVVSNAEFNKTVFAGKLTKQQLETHLQQRALIHNELHRILIAADPALHIPYGPIQKNVLVLLFTDLITMGSGWPTEEQARPLTQQFLKEIRDSEKKGPYFALGVWHVYYGGITNGGRMIGEKIGETLRFTPTYYEKSDGYPEYLPEVDKITDPTARQEMIRGGQAAYRYIIAISNEEIFKAGQ